MGKKSKEDWFMRKVLLESDVIIDILRNFKKTIKRVESLLEDSELFISGITEAEIFADKDMENEKKRKAVIDLFSKLKKINPTNEIFRVAGKFRRKYKLPLVDCIIGATAYSIGAELFTRNVKDFRKIKEIKTLD